MTLKDKLTADTRTKILRNAEEYPNAVDALLLELGRYNYVNHLPWDIVRSLYIWTDNNTVPIGMINPYAFFLDE